MAKIKDVAQESVNKGFLLNGQESRLLYSELYEIAYSTVKDLFEVANYQAKYEIVDDYTVQIYKPDSGSDNVFVKGVALLKGEETMTIWTAKDLYLNYAQLFLGGKDFVRFVALGITDSIWTDRQKDKAPLTIIQFCEKLNAALDYDFEPCNFTVWRGELCVDFDYCPEVTFNYHEGFDGKRYYDWYVQNCDSCTYYDLEEYASILDEIAAFLTKNEIVLLDIEGLKWE